MSTVRVRRKRGIQRIDQLLDAAAQVFAQHGYERATMTEIATRASSSVGSLYQFFPDKESLSNALIQRYTEKITCHFDALRAEVAGMLPLQVADRLIDFANQIATEAPFIIRLMSNDTQFSIDVSAQMRARLCGIFMDISPSLVERQGEAMADATMLLLRLVVEVGGMAERVPLAREELKAALRAYLDQALR